MLYRTLDTDKDYVLGPQLRDNPECVGQAVMTRLMLWLGEWFLDTTDGTPWMQGILGHNTNYDLEIQRRILETPNVIELLEYSSSLDTARNLRVSAKINTKFGIVQLQVPQ